MHLFMRSIDTLMIKYAPKKKKPNTISLRQNPFIQGPLSSCLPELAQMTKTISENNFW